MDHNFGSSVTHTYPSNRGTFLGTHGIVAVHTDSCEFVRYINNKYLVFKFFLFISELREDLAVIKPFDRHERQILP